MLSITLLAIELAVLMPTVGPFARYHSIPYSEVLILLWLGLGGTVGAVVAQPFKFPGTGATIGLFINFFAIIFAVVGHVFY
jgi:NhaP-type Na+/H+ or K+/H+ antiporter